MLCELLVAGACLRYFPAHVKKSDIAGYGEMLLAGNDNKKPAIRFLHLINSGPEQVFCLTSEEGNEKTLKLLERFHVGDVVEYACTKKAVAAWKERQRRFNLLAIQRQHEDSK